MDGWMEYVNGREKLKRKMEHRECWVGLSVLVGVDVLLDTLGRINRLPICIYGGFMDVDVRLP